MEEYLGRKLTSEELVHHINEDKLDNRVENLQVVSKAEHMRIHNAGTYRNPLNTDTHKQCPLCKKVKRLEDFVRSKNRPHGRGARCSLCHSEWVKAYHHKRARK